MNWVYLSPHLDDIALSCGALCWQQAQENRSLELRSPEIWTICAGDPPPLPLSPFAESLHARWDTGPGSTAARREEDIEACRRLGAGFRHYPIPDCIYRRVGPGAIAAYASEGAIFGPLHPAESELVDDLAAELRRSLTPQMELVCPLALGGHVDHRLTRLAAERLERPLWFYADYPYAAQTGDSLASVLPGGCEMTVFPVSGQALHAWCDAVAAHRSQISTFWPDLAAMRASIERYCSLYGGIRLWRHAALR